MSAEVAIPEDVAVRFEASLEREHAAERDLLRAIVKWSIVSLPIMIAVFLLFAAITFSDKVEWYVWIGFGVGIGVIGAVLLGALAGATMNAHKLDEVDRITAGLEPDAP